MSTEGGINQGVGNFLQGSGTGDSIVWVGYVGNFGVNVEEGRGYTHVVPATDHGEAREDIRRQDMGHAGSCRRTRVRGNPLGENIHVDTAGNRGAVGGTTSLI